MCSFALILKLTFQTVISPSELKFPDISEEILNQSICSKFFLLITQGVQLALALRVHIKPRHTPYLGTISI